MKKAILIGLLVIFGLSVSAQELKDFCGIPFGSSQEKVMTIMEKNGGKITVKQPGKLIYENAKYEGISNSKVIFIFANDRLSQGTVIIPTTSAGRNTKEYDKISDIIKTAYPEAEYNTQPPQSSIWKVGEIGSKIILNQNGDILRLSFIDVSVKRGGNMQNECCSQDGKEYRKDRKKNGGKENSYRGGKNGRGGRGR